MTELLVTAVAALLAITSLFVLSKAHRKGSSRSGKALSKRDRSWGVVLVIPAAAPRCAGAAALEGKTLPVEEQQPTPLPHCDVVGCRCYYDYLQERRSGNDRRSGRDRREDIRVRGTSRRSREDRRRGKSGWIDWS